jgi:signal transduction histidine kinase
MTAATTATAIRDTKPAASQRARQPRAERTTASRASHLLSLINDILDLSKIEAGRMELELMEFHLPLALESALTLVRERAARRGLAIELAVDGAVGDVRADERKVRQVLLKPFVQRHQVHAGGRPDRGAGGAQ